MLGLGVNLASVWLLGSDHEHGHGHHHGHARGYHDHADAARHIMTPAGTFGLEIHEDGAPPRFRLIVQEAEFRGSVEAMSIETLRPDGTRQTFAMIREGDLFKSIETIPEPRAFDAPLRFPGSYRAGSVTFEEHAQRDDDAIHRDNNTRAVVVCSVLLVPSRT